MSIGFVIGIAQPKFFVKFSRIRIHLGKTKIRCKQFLHFSIFHDIDIGTSCISCVLEGSLGQKVGCIFSIFIL